MLSPVQLFCIPTDYRPLGALAHGSSPREQYCSGLPFPPPGDLPDPGLEPMSPALACGFFTTELPGRPYSVKYTFFNIFLPQTLTGSDVLWGRKWSCCCCLLNKTSVFADSILGLLLIVHRQRKGSLCSIFHSPLATHLLGMLKSFLGGLP